MTVNMRMNSTDRQRVLDAVNNSKGITTATIAVKLGIDKGLVFAYIRELLDDNKILKVGRSRGSSYYPIDYDRTTHRDNDTQPIVNKTKPKAEPKVEVAKVERKEIPANIWVVEPKAEEPKVKEIPKAGPKGDEDDNGIGEPIPVEPTPAEAKPVIDYDAIAIAITTLKGLHTGVKRADEHIDDAINTLTATLTNNINRCPFCGARPKLTRESSKYYIGCSCGTSFVWKNSHSAIETIKAYNMRVTA